MTYRVDKLLDKNKTVTMGYIIINNETREIHSCWKTVQEANGAVSILNSYVRKQKAPQKKYVNNLKG